MDAHRKYPPFSKIRIGSKIVDGLLVIALVTLALTGLWQAYGRWLLGWATHVG